MFFFRQAIFVDLIEDFIVKTFIGKFIAKTYFTVNQALSPSETLKVFNNEIHSLSMHRKLKYFFSISYLLSHIFFTILSSFMMHIVIKLLNYVNEFININLYKYFLITCIIFLQNIIYLFYFIIRYRNYKKYIFLYFNL